jgi:hypothetical protein
MTLESPEQFFSPDPVEVDVGFGSPQRQERGSVAMRLLLVLPQLLALIILSIAAAVLAVVGWFAALALGRLPRWIADFQMRWIAYGVRVAGYGLLLLDDYPPFSLSAPDYPVAVAIGASRLSRLKVFFRWLLAIPVWIVSALVTNGLFVFSPILWLVTLIRGQTPQSLFSAAAAVIRYQARLNAYLYLVTDFYPRHLLGDFDTDPAPEADGRELRLVLSAGARRFVWLFVVLGIASGIGNAVLQNALRPAPTPAGLVSAETRFEAASAAFVNAVGACGTGATAYRCAERPEREWGRAFDRFGAELKRVPLSGSRRANADELARQASVMAAALQTASQAPSGAAYLAAFSKVQSNLSDFETAAQQLFGHSL